MFSLAFDLRLTSPAADIIVQTDRYAKVATRCATLESAKVPRGGVNQYAAPIKPRPPALRAQSPRRWPRTPRTRTTKYKECSFQGVGPGASGLATRPWSPRQPSRNDRKYSPRVVPSV